MSLAWLRAEAAALAARAREGVALGEEFGLVAEPTLAARALAALEAFIVDAELVPAPTPQPPRRGQAPRGAPSRRLGGPQAHARTAFAVGLRLVCINAHQARPRGRRPPSGAVTRYWRP